VGHSLESSLVALELVFEHRNYVPSFGILFAAAYYLVWGMNRLTGTQRLIYPVAGLLVVVLAFTTFTRAGIWRDKFTLIEFSLRNHPGSSRTHGEFATMNARHAGDVELAYAHWARAAALNPSSVLELIEMNKVLTKRILALEDQGETAGTGIERAAPPSRFDAPIVVQLDYMKALDRLIAGEISARLADRPVLMGNVAALRTLESCIRAQVPHCAALHERAIDWYLHASGNPRMSGKARAILRLRLARLQVLQGDTEKAVQSVEAAVRADPGHVIYLFELAALHLAREDLDAAERVIAKAEKRTGASGIHRGLLQDLKDDLARARILEKGAASSEQ
jgi:tetratricopeptide (TPR) repeat protein